MSGQSEKVIQDLLIKCQFKYKDLTKRDLLSALNYFKELFVKIERHVYSNGITKDLVTLTGTIPVTFKSSRYNIPVQLFLSDVHPHEPPLVYVRPTPDMRVNVSETVDTNGRVYLPYLNEWKYPTSDLYMLINLLSIKFGEKTPLYSKPSGSTGSSNNSGGFSNAAQPNPRPLSSVMSNSTPYSPLSTNNNAIPTPPYPLDALRPNYPMPGANASLNNNPLPTYPLPPYPVIENSIPNFSSYQQQQNPYYPKQPVTQPGNLKSDSSSNIYGQTRSSYPLHDNVNKPFTDTDTIKPEYYRMSLISAVQDKIRSKYREARDEKNAEIDSLKRIRNDLEQSQMNLTSLISEAESESSNIEELTNELRLKCSQLNEAINRQQLREKADIEDAVVTTTPLYRQLLQLFAEELAIQDYIFYLGEGLAHKTISLDNFLKQVRFLSRKQFFLRATMQLAREKAGLPT
jgi:ESCRT-I complex subunit TSG101